MGQLVSHRGLCALIVLNKILDIPEELQEILKDEEILKVGLNVFNHADRMNRDYGVDVSNTLDLRYLVKQCQYQVHNNLSRLSAAYLNIDIQGDDWRLQNIAWKSKTFSEEEINHAANNVHATIRLFTLFEEKLVKEKYAGDRKKFIEEICVPNLDEDFPRRKVDKNAAENDDGKSHSSLPQQEIRVVSNSEECQAVVEQLRLDCGEYNVLGFDCEWSSRRVSLLQLASHRGLCALIRLCRIQTIPLELKELLKDKEILKVGISPWEDAKKLKRDYGLSVASTLDLKKLSRKCKYRATGLGALSEEVLSVKLNHKKRGRMTQKMHRRWENSTIDDVNIQYAADDAHVSIVLFQKFQEKLIREDSGDHTKSVKRFIEEHCKGHLK